MNDTGSKLTRRKFIIAGTAAVTAPLVMKMADSDPVAEAASKKAATPEKIYYIGRQCIGCQVCRTFCPAGAIEYGDSRNEIDQEKCIHCGTCFKECPICVISETVL